MKSRHLIVVLLRSLRSTKYLTLLLYLILTFNKTIQRRYLKLKNLSTVIIDQAIRKSSSRHLAVLLSSFKISRYLTLLLYLILTNQTGYLKSKNLSTVIIDQAIRRSSSKHLAVLLSSSKSQNKFSKKEEPVFRVIYSCSSLGKTLYYQISYHYAENSNATASVYFHYYFLPQFKIIVYGSVMYIRLVQKRHFRVFGARSLGGV